MAAWILLTYGMLIRAMQGPDAERQLISAWGLCLVIELVRMPIEATSRTRKGGVLHDIPLLGLMCQNIRCNLTKRCFQSEIVSESIW